FIMAGTSSAKTRFALLPGHDEGIVGWAKRSVPTIPLVMWTDGGHGARAPLPALHTARSQKFTRFEIAPSTTRFEPVVKEEAGLARNTAALAISCGVAMRPVGLRASASW